MDKLSIDISTMTPDFVITEHSIKKNHKTYYERREAKAYNMDQESFQRLDVKITRCIGDFCLTVSISQSGIDEIFVHEETNLSERGLEEFKEDWNANWRPVLPKEDGLTPLMLTICNLEPYFRTPQAFEKDDNQSASSKKNDQDVDFSNNTLQVDEDQLESENTEKAEPKPDDVEKLQIPDKNIIVQTPSTKNYEESYKNNVQTYDQTTIVTKENIVDDPPKADKDLITGKNLNTTIEEPIPTSKTEFSEPDRIESLEKRVSTLEEQVKTLTEMTKRLHEIILEH
jgi:hypothetical protein